jgi:hypothetical protein
MYLLKKRIGGIYMQIIYDLPNTGKTTRILKLCSENNGYLISRDAKLCRVVIELAERLNIKINKPIPFEDIYNYDKYAGYHDKRKFYIDNLDLIIKKFSNITHNDLNNNNLTHDIIKYVNNNLTMDTFKLLGDNSIFIRYLFFIQEQLYELNHDYTIECFTATKE